MDGSFGALLRLHRRSAGLTQEALAERAALSGQAVGALERGDRRFPHRDTVERLATALGLTEDQRMHFAAAASRRPNARAGAGVGTGSQWAGESAGAAEPGPASRWASAEPAGVGDPAGAGPVPVKQLPASVAHFTGRSADVKTMIELLERSSAVVVAAISGMAGVGKTCLAVYVAHCVADQFPDGQLYLDLRGDDPGAPMPAEEALAQLMRALGAPPADFHAAGAGELDEVAARFRSHLAGRKMLLVLDNAANAEQVLPLLPSAAGCAAIITSRRVLSAVPQAHQVRLDVLSKPDAVQLLATTAGQARVDAEPAAAATVVRLCGRLPLAIHLAGARLASRPQWPIAHLAERLGDEHRRLDELELVDAGVRASFAVTIDQLTGSGNFVSRLTAAGYAMLGVPDMSVVSTPVAARLLDLSEHDAERLLERLTDLHLLEAATPGRYLIHDLLRVYARESAQATFTRAERAAAITRVIELYIAVAWRTQTSMSPYSVRRMWAQDQELWDAGAPESPARDDAPAWLDAHRATMLQMALQAERVTEVAPELVVRLCIGLSAFYRSRGHWLDWVQLAHAALAEAARGPDRVAEAMVQMDLGIALAESGEHSTALEHIGQSLAAFEALQHLPGIAMCLTNLSHVLRMSGELRPAVDAAERGLDLNRSMGDTYAEATTCAALGHLYGALGDHERELLHYEKSLELSEKLGLERASASVSLLIGSGYRARARHQDALAALERSAELFHRVGDPVGETASLLELGRLHMDLGDARAAVEALAAALALTEEYGNDQLQGDLLQELRTAVAGLIV